MTFIYKGLEAELTHHVITKEEVDRQIQRLLDSTPRIIPVQDRPTKDGDEVVLDYSGFCDGEQFQGGTAKMQTLVLGSGTFIPGFEEQLLDKVPGEKVVVDVTFPEEYHAPELAGKKAEFRCVIHEIRIKGMYELDDIFAKEVGQCDTLAEMKEKMQKSLQDYTDEQGQIDLQERLLRQAADSLDFAPDTDAIEKEVQEQVKVLEGQLASQGLTLDMYCSFLGTSKEDITKDYYPAAEANLRKQAAVDKIFELEKMSVSEEDIGQALAEICRANGMTVEQLKPYYNAEFEQAVLKGIKTDKVIELICDNAKITHR